MTDQCGAYEQIWILGDNFVHDSAAYITRLFGMEGAVLAPGEQSYISKKYQVHLFKNSANVSHVRSALGRFRNLLASALNANDKLPKYIILVLENDLIRCIKFNQPGISELYGRVLRWLSDELHALVMSRKHHLLPKAKKFAYPQIFWVCLPYHQNFVNDVNRHKFNQCLETVVNMHPEMKSLKIRRIWSNVDSSVSRIGIITETGMQKYWRGIDEALEFWENGRKRSGTPFGDTVEQSKRRRMTDRFNTNYKWFNKNNKSVNSR